MAWLHAEGRSDSSTLLGGSGVSGFEFRGVDEELCSFFGRERDGLLEKLGEITAWGDVGRVVGGAVEETDEAAGVADCLAEVGDGFFRARGVVDGVSRGFDGSYGGGLEGVGCCGLGIDEEKG